MKLYLANLTAWVLSLGMSTTIIEVGMTVTVLNKYNDEIAEGRVTEVERDGFTLDSGEAVMFRHVSSFDGKTLKLTVAA